MSESIKTGGPAFPHGTCGQGMSLRDYFAAKAIPCAYKYWMEDYYHPQSENGAENEERTSLTGSMERVAEYAYDLADAMLAARDKK